MNKTQEALKLALEALEYANAGMDECHKEVGFDFANEKHDVEQAITAIREALAEQPAQQICRSSETANGAITCDCNPGECPFLQYQPAQQQEPPTVAELLCVCGAEWEWRNRDWELVSTQPVSKPWVGLTSEQIKKLETAAGFALEVLVKHRQMMGEYPMGMLGVNAAEKLEEAFREINEAYRDDIANLRQAIEAKLREKNA